MFDIALNRGYNTQSRLLLWPSHWRKPLPHVNDPAKKLSTLEWLSRKLYLWHRQKLPTVECAGIVCTLSLSYSLSIVLPIMNMVKHCLHVWCTVHNLLSEWTASALIFYPGFYVPQSGSSQQPQSSPKPGGDYQNQNEYLNGFQFWYGNFLHESGADNLSRLESIM